MNIVEFAKHLNLSVGTVSRALNDRPEVNVRTRELVRRRARELGFERNAAARRLVTGRNFLIRLVCPHHKNVLSDYYLVSLARALESAAGSAGYGLLLRLGDAMDEIPQTDPVDGIVLVASREMTAADVDSITGGGRIPTVIISEPEWMQVVYASYVLIDTRPAVAEALRYLVGLGHRRIAYIGSGLLGGEQSHIRAAFPQMLASAGVDADPSLLVEAGLTPEEAAESTRSLLSLPDPPTAIFARTDILALGAIRGIESAGKHVPADISVIGHDDIDFARYVTPPLTTVAIDIPNIAVTAVESVMEMIDGQITPSVKPRGGHLVVRDSCAQPPSH